MQSHNKDKFIRLTAVSWIREFVLVSEKWSLPYSQLFDALLPCLLDEEEARGAGRVLKAAAMTYVAALLTSLLQLLRFLLIFLGRGGGSDRRGGRR